MNRKGAALAILVVGLVIIVGSWYLMPTWLDREQKVTSDATMTKGKIKIDLDNWIGYFPLRSSELKGLMRRCGYQIVINDDSADYAKRMDRLNNGEVDFVVATVDSYILNAQKHNFPGTIVMVIDESRGGDAILALKDKAKTLDDIKSLSDLKVAFTPDSPSHHLLKSTSDHFSIPEILPMGKNRIETNGSKEAVNKILKEEVDIAVAWEPDVSRALKSGKVVKILGTEDTEKLIVDILIVNRKYADKNPEVVELFLANYFKVLKKYRENSDLLYEHVKDDTEFKASDIESMLKGVRWINFTENCEEWFGISVQGGWGKEGLIETIESTIKILKNSDDFDRNPLPNQDPYRISNRSFLDGLLEKGIISGTHATASSTVVDPIEADFPEWTEVQWKAAREWVTLNLDIKFQQGSSVLDLIAKQSLDDAVDKLKKYPKFRLVLAGHTDDRGDKVANKQLSKDRAEAVVRYITITYGIDSDRVRAVGYGGEKPLKRKSGESLRSWRYKLSRVEIILVQENI